MTKFKMVSMFDDFLQSFKLPVLVLIFMTSLLITAILASSYYFQNIIQNGVSKKKIVAKNTIEVIDTKKTEFLRQEIANKIKPILTPVEDAYIKQSLDNTFDLIKKIRIEHKNYEGKLSDLSAVIDVANPNKELSAVRFLLSLQESALENLIDNTHIVLDEILELGISETDFQSKEIEDLIYKSYSNIIPKAQAKTISVLIEHVVIPNLIVDEHLTEIAKNNARDSVKPRYVTFKRGDTILREGEPITQLKKDALKKAGYTVLELNKGSLCGIFLLVFLTLTLITFYVKNYEKNYFNMRHLLIQFSLFAFATGIVVIMSHYTSYELTELYFAVLPAYTLIIAIFTSPVLACLSVILMLLLFSVVLNFDQQLILTLVFTTIVAGYSVSKINYTNRFDLIRCGLITAVTSFLVTFLVRVFEWQFDDTLLSTALLVAACTFFSSMIALAALPIIEKISKVLTPYGLIELADHNQKLLATMQDKAPGTYHHCLTVANYCEAAAEAIGANPILARVGAFYHDIGKLKRPLFFIENQSYFGIENPHEKLSPRLSKMVITSHTKDGVELARQYGLPQSVINFIQQHHGESLAGHFYNQAVEQEGAQNVDEEHFRYPGPKPNTKETAILMLADAVESALRSLKNPTQEEIENLINKIITERLNDSQLSDSPLTLKDIKLIANTFNRIARGMQHDRIKYQQSALNEFEEKNKIRIVDNAEKKLENKIEKKIQKKSNEKQND